MTDANSDRSIEADHRIEPVAICRLHGVSLAGRARPRLDRVTVEIPAGFTAVLGWSGAGKTSLLNVVSSFEKPDSGTCQVASAERGRLPVFWVPPDDGLWPHLSVGQHLEYVVGKSGSNAREVVDPLLAAFDLQELRNAPPGGLSQGERARLSVCRALASRASLLVMDEPLVHLDPGRVGRYRDALSEWCRSQNSSLLFSTHSPEMALTVADHAVCLSEGRLSFAGPLRTLYESPPTNDLALLLGPMNWVSSAESTAWLGVSAQADRCWRAEQIEIVSEGNSGPCRVESTRLTGAATETELQLDVTGQRRRWIHLTSPRPLARGDRVRVRPLDRE